MKDGLIEEFYDNGQLERKGNYKDRKREGPWEWYYENGQLSQKGNYKNGELDGTWVMFKENGQIWVIETYRYTEEKMKDGLVEKFHENGQLRSTGNYKDGKPDGIHETYHDDGDLHSKKNTLIYPEPPVYEEELQAFKSLGIVISCLNIGSLIDSTGS